MLYMGGMTLSISSVVYSVYACVCVYHEWHPVPCLAVQIFHYADDIILSRGEVENYVECYMCTKECRTRVICSLRLAVAAIKRPRAGCW